MVGWTSEARRSNLLSTLSDPFITACYVTKNTPYPDEPLKGKLAGFMLVSHESGDRDEFSDPSHYTLEPKKWRYAVRALRAFSYLPEHSPDAESIDEGINARARAIAAFGEEWTNRPDLIRVLQETPWLEVDVYQASGTRPPPSPAPQSGEPTPGLVKAGPQNKGGYFVPPVTRALPHRLYVLRLDGPTTAYVGGPCNGLGIYKVGLSISPIMRCNQFRSAMPEGTFCWQIDRTCESFGPGWSFRAAEAGEFVMKRHLAAHGRHLGGEFYLAAPAEVEHAWGLGLEAAAVATKTQ